MKRGLVQLDPGSIVVMAITCVLFVVALVAKGLTHDLLLEAGVFLVSVKLVIMAYKNGLATNRLQATLDDVADAIRRLQPSEDRASRARDVDA